VTREDARTATGERARPVRSLWLEEALDGREESPRLEGSERADVCIVGGGFTGLWTALRLKELEPSLDVVLVERDVCGSGASGRNGGFVLSWWAKFALLEQTCGTAEALRLARASSDGIAEMKEFCDANGIDAHFRRDGWLWTATSGAQIGAWEPVLARLEELGESPFQRLAPEEVARRSGSSRHLAGVFEPGAATVHPGLLARGLRRVAIERGVRVLERSPMTSLDRASPPSVRTERGAVTADRVVLALNAWAGALRELRHAITVVASDVIATEPIPHRLRAIGWDDGSCIDDSRMLVNYYRTTLDGRIVFGKGGGALSYRARIGSEYEVSSPRAEELAGVFRWLYPELADVSIAGSWLGPIDRSPVGLPFFTPLGGREDIVAGAGYSGNGVGPSYLGGRILASLALGRDDEWSRAGLVRPPAGSFPPEPIRYVGGRLVQAAVVRKERAEDAGERAGRLTTWLASLAPPGLVPQSENHGSRP
jgi:putative aminophosphonate oxidoreductase